MGARPGPMRLASTEPGDAVPAGSITVYEDGPLIVRGDVALQTMAGEPIEPGRATIALCRCGRSAQKPFCDGTHALARFRAAALDPAPGAEPDTAA